MFRLIGSLITFFITVSGMYWLWETQPMVRSVVSERLQTGDFLTLEIKYSPESIMEKNSKDLIKGENYMYLEPELSFYPYALLEVKYIKDSNGTGEGMMLWSLNDGEMVINTSSWEKTHGYEDAILSHASRNDFKVLNILGKNGGALDRKGLLNALHVESDTLDEWLESCKDKQLIIQRGNDYRLHLENPRLQRDPTTKLTFRFVNKPYKHSVRIPKTYSMGDIERVSKAAFGNGFAVRNAKEIYLPVYTIAVQNPDGSILTTYWNAVTGRRMGNVFGTH